MLYEDYTINLPMVLPVPIEVINSKVTEDVHFMLSKTGVKYNFETFNCKGVSVGKGVVKSKKNTLDVMVPSAGYIRITSIN